MGEIAQTMLNRLFREYRNEIIEESAAHLEHTQYHMPGVRREMANYIRDLKTIPVSNSETS